MSEAPLASPSSRAGRNLPAAIGVGLLLGALIIGTHVWRKELFLVLATASVSVGCWEIAKAMQRKGIRAPVFPVVLGCVVQMTGAYFLGEQALFVAFVLTAALIVMWRGSESISGAATDVSAGVFIAAYPALLAGFAMLLLAAPDGAWRSFTFLCVTEEDVGRLRRLVPRLHPRRHHLRHRRPARAVVGRRDPRGCHRARRHAGRPGRVGDQA